MKRRAFIAGLVASGITRATFAESNNTRTIGILSAAKPDDPLVRSFLAAFVDQLRSLGWIEGRNIRFEHRWASGDPAVMRNGAQELQALAPSAILAVTAPAALVLKSQKSSIPIVFVLVIDAVALGVVNNLAKPADNVTGFTNFEPNMGSKWLGLLKEMAPSIRRVGCMFNPDLDASFADILINVIQSNASYFAVEVSRASARNISDIDPLVESFSGTGGLIILPSNFNITNRAEIASAAVRHQVPTISPFALVPAAGGLMSYGSDPEEEFRKAGVYMNRILAGENPGDLPVQAPTNFKFVINLNTAKALGLSVPSTLLARADEVIE